MGLVCPHQPGLARVDHGGMSLAAGVACGDRAGMSPAIRGVTCWHCPICQGGLWVSGWHVPIWLGWLVGTVPACPHPGGVTRGQHACMSPSGRGDLWAACPHVSN